MPRRIVFPVAGKSNFTDTWGAARADTGRHQGVDIFAERGTPVVAVVDGTITKMGPQKIGGNRLWVNSQWYYAHLDHYAAGIKTGVKVKAGQIIGYVGDTGDAKGTPTHLHFGWSPDGSSGARWENPYSLLRTASQAPAPDEAVGDPTVDAAAAPDTTGQQDVALSFPQVQPPPTALGVASSVPELPGSQSFSLEQFNPSQTWQLLAADPLSSPETRHFASLLGE